MFMKCIATRLCPSMPYIYSHIFQLYHINVNLIKYSLLCLILATGKATRVKARNIDYFSCMNPSNYSLILMDPIDIWCFKTFNYVG